MSALAAEVAGLVGARLGGDMTPAGSGEPAFLPSEASEARLEEGGLLEVRAEMRRAANLPDCERGRVRTLPAAADDSSMMSSNELVTAVSSALADMANTPPPGEA